MKDCITSPKVYLQDTLNLQVQLHCLSGLVKLNFLSKMGVFGSAHTQNKRDTVTPSFLFQDKLNLKKSGQLLMAMIPEDLHTLIRQRPPKHNRRTVFNWIRDWRTFCHFLLSMWGPVVSSDVLIAQGCFSQTDACKHQWLNWDPSVAESNLKMCCCLFNPRWTDHHLVIRSTIKCTSQIFHFEY